VVPSRLLAGSNTRARVARRVLVCRCDDVRSFIVPGCTVMVVLYSWSGVRDIPWSRVRVRVLAHCKVMVLAFAGYSLSLR